MNALIDDILTFPGQVRETSRNRIDLNCVLETVMDALQEKSMRQKQ